MEGIDYLVLLIENMVRIVVEVVKNLKSKHVKRHRLCYVCRHKGHFSRDCPVQKLSKKESLVECSEVSNVRFMRFTEMGKGAEVVNNDVKGSMNHDRKYNKNGWNQPGVKRKLKVNLIRQGNTNINERTKIKNGPGDFDGKKAFERCQKSGKVKADKSNEWKKRKNRTYWNYKIEDIRFMRLDGNKKFVKGYRKHGESVKLDKRKIKGKVVVNNRGTCVMKNENAKEYS